MRGIIASDIDRTLTDRDHTIPVEVVKYLKKCHLEGFEIVFITGRPFNFAKKALGACDFPYHLGVQNGAEVLKMPEEEFRMQRFITRDMAEKIHAASPFKDRDFFFYTGVERGDHCYYNPNKFSGHAREYLDRFLEYKVINWVAAESIDEMDNDKFTLMRLFGTLEEMEDLKKRVLKVADVTCVILNDVATPGKFILMVTEKQVDKGHSLKRLIDHYEWTGCTIGCGDDLNDMSLFDAVDISIGMENGHVDLLKKATIIAKPSYDKGIIQALEQAIGMINDGN